MERPPQWIWQLLILEDTCRFKSSVYFPVGSGAFPHLCDLIFSGTDEQGAIAQRMFRSLSDHKVVTVLFSSFVHGKVFVQLPVDIHAASVIDGRYLCDSIFSMLKS